MRILLVDIYSGQNRGDYLITRGTVEHLRRTFGATVEIEGLSTFRDASLPYLRADLAPYSEILSEIRGNPSGVVQSPAEYAKQSSFRRSAATAARIGRLGGEYFLDGILDKFRTWDKVIEHFRKFDLILFVGGAYLDASTPEDFALLLSHVFPAYLARRGGVPYGLLGESLAGADRVWAHWALRPLLTHARFVIFREHISLAQARSAELLGPNPDGRALVEPDLAFGLTENFQPHRRQHSSAYPPIVGVAFRTWSPTRENLLSEDPADLLARALARAAARSPMRFRLIPFSRISSSSTDDDQLACERLFQKMRAVDPRLDVEQLALPPPQDLNGLATALSQLDFAVCVRLHATIVCAMLGIPSVAVEYRGHKARGVCDDLGMARFCVAQLTDEDLEEKVVRLAREFPDIRPRLERTVDRLHAQLRDDLDSILLASVQPPTRQPVAPIASVRTPGSAAWGNSSR